MLEFLKGKVAIFLFDVKILAGQYFSLLPDFWIPNSSIVLISKRSELQAGQFSTITLLLRSHVLVIDAVCHLVSSN